LKRVEVTISGLGGQGVVLAGQILGRAAAYDGKNVIQTQSYGAEARGSQAKSEVIISDSKIGFPTVRQCDVLVAMSQGSLNKYWKYLKEKGFLLVDTTFVKTIPKSKAKTFEISITEHAEKAFGTRTYANILMLGALTKITRIVSEESMERAITESVPKNFVEINKQAYREGTKLAKQKN